MKKLFRLFALAFLFSPAAFQAHSQDAGNFYQNLLISEEMRLEENSGKAQDSAGKLLDSKPETIKIKGPKLRKHTSSNKKTTQQAEKKKMTYGNAPFGLIWGSNITDIKNMGVVLEATGEKDYVNNFSASFLPKTVNEFRDVVLTFGTDDKLWRIIAYGNFTQDTPNASKVLTVYNKYYKLLSQKYGNAKQFYTPKVTNVDKTVEIGGGKTKTVTEQIEEPIGGKNFLNELQSGEAVLYSTFENGKVGVALAVNVDGKNRSYIIIDYKNLEIMQAHDQNTLDAL